MVGKSYHAHDKKARQGDRAPWPDSARKSDAAITHESVRGDLEDAASRSCKKQGREQLLNCIADRTPRCRPSASPTSTGRNG